MIRFIVILSLILLSSSLMFAQGSSVGAAAALSPSGSASASMSDASKDHYWKVTTTTDGYLRIQITSASTIDVDVTLYDTDGTTFMTSDGQSGTYSEVFGFVKPGTYYVYARRWTGTTGSYTITSTFASPTRAVESESNDTPASALALNPTATSTGHLGYYSGGKTDTDDYWKITTTTDGWLRVQVVSDSLDLRGDLRLDLDVTLYDINGTTFMTSDGRSGTFSQVDAFVRPGTYAYESTDGLDEAGPTISNQTFSRRRSPTKRLKTMTPGKRRLPRFSTEASLDTWDTTATARPICSTSGNSRS